MKPEIPKSLKTEHEKLHLRLKSLIEAGGEVGKHAKIVAEVLHPHFIKEEEFALPQLGLLRHLIKEEPIKDIEEVISMTNKLKLELNEMIDEHKDIIKALEKLEIAAIEEENVEAEGFAEDLIIHAQTEEQVLYPASILIGEYLKKNNC